MYGGRTNQLHGGSIPQSFIYLPDLRGISAINGAGGMGVEKQMSNTCDTKVFTTFLTCSLEKWKFY